MAATQPKVSIVVTSLNAEGTIADCLSSLTEQDYDNLEILLVDAGSSDATVGVAKQAAGQRKDFRLIIDETATTPARGRNLGTKFASGELLAFTDSDCVAEPNWISALVNSENWQEDTGGVGGKTVFTKIPEGKNMLKALHGAIETRLGNGGSAQFFSYKSRTTVRSLPSCNVMYQTAVFAQHGGFDESLRYCEDSCLNARIRKSGLKLSYVPEGVVHHQHRRSAKQFARWIYEYGKGRGSASKKDLRAFSSSMLLLALAAVLLLGLAVWHLLPLEVLFISALALYSSTALTSALFNAGRGIKFKILYLVGYFLIHLSYTAGLVVGLARPSGRVSSR